MCLFGLFRDGRTLVGGGKSRMLHMWNLETKKLIKILQLPAKVTMVKQLEFLPESFDGGANQVGSNKFFSRKCLSRILSHQPFQERIKMKQFVRLASR